VGSAAVVSQGSDRGQNGCCRGRHGWFPVVSCGPCRNTEGRDRAIGTLFTPSNDLRLYSALCCAD
jgi:hypothetical protein